MPTTSNVQALGVVVAWLDAMRRGESDAVAGCFRPDVSWHGVPDDALCSNRDEVLGMLERSPRLNTEALELIVGDSAVVLGVRSPELREIGDVPLAGQLYNVFEIREGAIASVRDFTRRGDALRAAGAHAPEWS